MTDVPSALADPSYCVTLYYFGCVFLGMLVIAGILFRACISICLFKGNKYIFKGDNSVVYMLLPFDKWVFPLKNGSSLKGKHLLPKGANASL